MCQSKVCGQEFMYILSCLKFYFSNPKMKFCSRLQDSNVAVSRVTWVWITQNTEIYCLQTPMANLARHQAWPIWLGTEPVSALASVLFYCSLTFFSWILSMVSLWWSHTDRVLTLNLNIQVDPTSTVLEHLESGPGPELGHMCCGLAHGQWL